MISTSAFSANLIIPDKVKYKDFLLEPWKQAAPSVVVFKDPYCPYCVKALQRLERLNQYNVFMFWSPILGKASTKKVNEIFYCSSPVSKDVFYSIINRTNKINCVLGNKSETAYLKSLNDEIVENYDPRSVPSYYFGGKKTYISQLDDFKTKIAMDITPVQLKWQRYKKLRIANTAHQGLANAIIFLPATSVKRSSLIESLKNETNYTWFLVNKNCLTGMECDEQEKLSEELRLLLDVTDSSEIAIVINGTVINPERYKRYFSTSLVNIITSQ